MSGLARPSRLRANACALRHAEGQRAASRGQPARDLARQPQPARQLVDRHRVPDPMRDADGVVVGQVGADARQIVHDVDADRLQVRGRPDARHLQQVRRVDGAARQDHLARRRHLAGPRPPCRNATPRSACRRTAAAWRTPWSRCASSAAPCACARKVRAVEPRKRPLRDICE